MIRVGFIFNEDICYWNGGINYYRNLIKILLNSDKFIPVVFCPNSVYDELKKRFGNIEIVSTQIVANSSYFGKIRKVVMYLWGRIPFIDRLLRENNIDIISHSTSIPLDKNSNIPSCNWIPDFQQHYLPDYFTRKAKRRQYYVNSLLIKHSTRIIVSSYDAKADLLKFYPFTQEKLVDVLQFSLPPKEEVFSSEEVLRKYSVKKREYYMIPNQFWKHKNHIVVIKAMKEILEKEGDISFKIIATGKKYDPRYPQYYNEIKKYIDQNKLSHHFICTGEIPYSDVMVLQCYSIAIIQPSLFEGWNTAVEECKQIGKKIILSNLNIHKEQAPNNVIYFDPQDARELSKILFSVYSYYDSKKEDEEKKKAEEMQSERWNNFSQHYIKILNSTLQYKRGKKI